VSVSPEALWSPPLPTAPDHPEAAVWRCLGEVMDPELPLSLVDLGLVYGVSVEGSTARVRLTFTATACPCIEFIHADVKARLLRETWLREVEVLEVWDPPWTTERVTPAGRLRLREVGVSA